MFLSVGSRHSNHFPIIFYPLISINSQIIWPPNPFLFPWISSEPLRPPDISLMEPLPISISTFCRPGTGTGTGTYARSVSGGASLRRCEPDVHQQTAVTHPQHTRSSSVCRCAALKKAGQQLQKG